MGKVQEKAVVKTAKYKVGDYLTAKDRVYLKVIGIIDSGMGPMYCLVSPRSENVKWESLYELESDSFEVSVPQYEKFKGLKAGDILRMGQGEDRPYATVLARTGEAVLLSQTPDKRKAEALLHLDKMVKEMAGDFGVSVEDILGEDERRDIKRMGSQLHASKIAGEWFSIERLTLMHWDLIEE